MNYGYSAAGGALRDKSWGMSVALERCTRLVLQAN
jgi:hypothetical protein